jgi:hypothetical protein
MNIGLKFQVCTINFMQWCGAVSEEYVRLQCTESLELNGTAGYVCTIQLSKFGFN